MMLILDDDIGDALGIDEQIDVSTLSPRRPPPSLDKLGNLDSLKPRSPSALAGGLISVLGGKVVKAVDKVAVYHGAYPWEEGGIGEPSAAKRDPERLHFEEVLLGRSVHLSPDLVSATIRGKSYGGFAISDQRLKRRPFGRWFELRVEEADASRWSDGLGLGVCAHPHEDHSLRPDGNGAYEGLLCDQLHQSWLVGYDGRSKVHCVSRLLLGPEMPAGAWQPNELMAGDVLGVLTTRQGDLLLFVNETLRVMLRGCGIPWDKHLHVAMDLEGSTQSVRLLDSNGTPGLRMEKIIHSLVREYNDADCADCDSAEATLNPRSA